MARCHSLALLSLIFILGIGIGGCQWRNKNKPSILVIAIDSLGFDQVNCRRMANRDSDSGFAILCSEAVRFTHAYTPSTMSQASLASILTGLYPSEHGVWHNGAKFLSANVDTVAEKAVRKGYRTSFLSGGPPIWSFSGIGQGFEQFYDHFNVRLGNLYNPAEKIFESWLNWQQRESGPFFSVAYLADLQFSNFETVDKLGVVRSRTYSSQLNEVDESLGVLFKELKKRGLWDKMNIFLVGLNGVANSHHPDELKSFNLHSSNTEVALMIKPSRKKRDLGLQWKIDKNVSLVDVGETLLDLIGEKAERENQGKLPIISLRSVLNEPTAAWDDNRMILTESSWSQWLGFAGTRFSVRVGHFLFIHDKKMKVFNTFVDHQEVAPILESDASMRGWSEKVMNYFIDNDMAPWGLFSIDLVEKWTVASKLWKGAPLPTDVSLGLNKLYKRRGWDTEVIHWVADVAVQKGHWQQLQRLSRRIQNPEWEYLAKRAMGEDLASAPAGCLRLLDKLEEEIHRQEIKVCEDDTFLRLMMWLSRRGKENSEKFKFLFVKRFRYDWLDRKIALNNYRVNLSWNVNYQKIQNLTLSQIVLSLPEFSKEKAEISRELNGYF